MDETTEIRPEAFTVTKPDLRRVQGIGVETETPRSRLYGLAIEFAAKNRTEFKQYVRDQSKHE